MDPSSSFAERILVVMANLIGPAAAQAALPPRRDDRGHYCDKIHRAATQLELKIRILGHTANPLTLKS
ncbi:hypothetical protein KM043_016595 [Ampulex compressa]|nr:hypothetical protein KM043_016595 [Ampulex compressa]